MNYEYCGMVLFSEIELPFFNTSNAEPLFYILKGKKAFTLSKESDVFFNDNNYIVNFGEKGYYQISKTAILCNFDDLKFIKATICNIPMAIIMILNDLLPIHCSSIISHTGGGVILLAGSKGTGKTTIAYYLNKYMDYDVFGDDVISVINVGQRKMLVNRGTIAMKLCGNIMKNEFSSSSMYGLEVYDGWDKYYCFPKKYAEFEKLLPIYNFYILKRDQSVTQTNIPDFLVRSNIINNIVGISHLETSLSAKIYNLVANIQLNKLSILTIPTGLDNLKMELPNIAKIMENKI